MKPRFLPALIALLLFFGLCSGLAQDKGKPEDQLKALVAKVNAKLQQNKKSEADLADEFKQFDVLLEEHKAEKTDAVAQIALMKAKLYAEVLDNPEKASEIVRQIKVDFPQTQQGKDADQILESLKQQTEAKKIRSALVEGAKFPDFEEKDIAGKPLSTANYKGSVVLIDFWATWCGPCVGELPNVLKTYEKHHPKGLEIIGISLDQDEKKLQKFITDRKMPWQQYFDGKGWENKLAARYGIQSIPSTFLLDREGKIIGKDLRGQALDEAVATAVAKK